MAEEPLRSLREGPTQAAVLEFLESITDTPTRLGWTQISMRDDRATIFPEP